MIAVGGTCAMLYYPAHRRRVQMRAPIRSSAAALALAVAVALPGAVAPALAKKTRRTPCSAHFLVDSNQALVVNGQPTLDVAGKQVTLAGMCTATASLKPIRNGWRLQAHWKSCGDLSKVRLTARIVDCKQLTLTLPAKKKPGRRFKATISPCDSGGVQYESTWDGIQNTIFTRHDCANDLCHGSAKQGGLDLRPDVAYRNLLQVPSTQVSSLDRVAPGDERRSYLWLKLLAKTDPANLPNYLPSGVQLSGSPMPNNTSTLSTDELEALRQWIYATAPEAGTVAGTEKLLKACLPAPVPINAVPLDPPPPDQGLQFVMPPWKLEAHSQHEICFATYFDFTAKVPAAFKIPRGDFVNGCFDANGCFVWNTQTLRQDPQSHHLILNLFAASVDQIHDLSFGAWTCTGGEKDGQACEPTDLASCGSGTCRSQIQETFACIGYGPYG